MRAVLLTGYGDADTLELGERPTPKPGPRDLRVAVHAASINPIDTKIRAGAQRLVIRYKLPHVLGLDVAGTVVEVGGKVTRFKVGDAIMASLDYKRDGSYAEEVLVDEGIAARKPEGLSFEQAAGLPLAGLTAWQALVKTARMTSGDKVFIQAGAGGVGHLAIQLAKAMGAEVTTTCSERNREFVTELGADHVIDYRKEDYAEVLAAPDSEQDLRQDIVLDSLGYEHRQKSLAVLKPGGAHVSIVSDMPGKVKQHGPLFGSLRAIGGVARFMLLARLRGYRASSVLQRPNADQLAELGKLCDEGKMSVTVDKTFSLEDLPEAHRASESGRTRGKLIVVVKN